MQEDGTPTLTAHGERQEREDASWRERTPAMRTFLQRNWLLVRSMEAEEGLVLQRLIQSRLDNAWQLHDCCHSLSAEPSDNSMLLNVEGHEVDVVFLGNHRGRVSVPTWHCNTCNSNFSADPLAANCFPSTPCSPSLWFHRPVLEFHKHLGLSSGTTYTGEVIGCMPSMFMRKRFMCNTADRFCASCNICLLGADRPSEATIHVGCMDVLAGYVAALNETGSSSYAATTLSTPDVVAADSSDDDNDDDPTAVTTDVAGHQTCAHLRKQLFASASMAYIRSTVQLHDPEALLATINASAAPLDPFCYCDCCCSAADPPADSTLRNGAYAGWLPRHALAVYLAVLVPCTRLAMLLHSNDVMHSQTISTDAMPLLWHVLMQCHCVLVAMTKHRLTHACAEERAWRRSACGDANLKTGRFKNVGSATKGIKPHLATFFGSAAEKVLQRHEDHALTLAAVIGCPDQPSVGDAQSAEHAQCSSSITAARPDAAYTNSAMHTFGTVAFSCVHTVPLSGGFVDMYTPEQFCYYLLVLRELFDVSDVSKHVPHTNLCF